MLKGDSIFQGMMALCLELKCGSRGVMMCMA
jgi:hypothetical protein